MEIPESIAAAAATLDRTNFLKTRDKWIRPSFDLTGLKYLREKAGRERDIRELYRGRAPYELLQNADDVKATHAAFVLTNDGLCFLHDGAWFSVANFRSLADGWSDKDPNQCIGHKGLGFRSVLDLTPSPAVIQIAKNWFGFRFGWSLNKGHIDETIHRNPELAAEVKSWSKYGQSTCPVMAIPGEIKKTALGSVVSVFERATRGDIGSGLTTMFWLPALDPDADRRVVESLDVRPLRSDREGLEILARFVQAEVPTLLPFLRYLKTVSLFNGTTQIVRTTLAGDRSASNGDQISVDVQTGGRTTRASYFQLSRAEMIPPQVRNDSETPRAVRQMSHASVRVSARLRDGVPIFDQDARIHVYFPTDEPTGFGITVHGDFYVKPDRTRLMPGRYNEWLMDVAGRLFAGDFLTRLLERYQTRQVFESLRPSLSAHEVANRFRTTVQSLIRKRTEPFIPTIAGRRLARDVALPSSVDAAGFWSSHFADALVGIAAKAAFLEPAIDSVDCRLFLSFAGVSPLASTVILDLVEGSSPGGTPTWWAEVYRHLATHDEFSRWGHSTLVGRRLLLTGDGDVIDVPPEGGTVVCFAPSGEAATLDVPGRFRSVFALLNDVVIQGSDHHAQVVRDWLMRACHVARFEASDIVPRAIRGSAQSLYADPLPYAELLGVWQFLQKILAVSRGIASGEFWTEVGRLPVPVSATEFAIAPAFLTYWPDGHAKAVGALAGVVGLRRLSPTFLADLVSSQDVPSSDWEDILESAGISGTPKVLKFVRLIGSGRETSFSAPFAVHGETRFTGERQHDENIAALDELASSMVWGHFAPQAQAHAKESRALQQLTVLEAFERCCALAEQESDVTHGASWQERLWSLVHSLPPLNDLPGDLVFRRLSSGGGFNESCGSFFRRQLEMVRWLPSTLGPATTSECFLRLRERRLISRGTSTEEIGDLLIPYVVADNLNDYVLLTGYGIESLEESASPGALVRFLALLGRQFQDEGVRNSWLLSRSRWRLLRGAIQESYRTLNQVTANPAIPDDLCLATHLNGDLGFRRSPWFYAEPGSPAERAFRNTVAFLDADRAYPRLFEQLGVVRLTIGESLDESLSGVTNAAEAPFLKRALVKDLGPYLLAVVIAKAEEQGHADLVRRRLHERFDVRVATEIEVTFALHADREYEASFRCPHFYLKRDLVELPGAIRETHYTLYVVGTADTTVDDLDGDALGEALAPVYCDGARDEYRSAFPRVVSRFLACRGDSSEMGRFLLEALNVSVSALDEAREETTVVSVPTPPPPPAKIVVGPAAAPSQVAHDLDERSQSLGQRVGQLFTDLKNLIGGSRSTRPTSAGQPHQPSRVTVVQKDRGRRGEEEFMRRTQRDGGWEGFVFSKDTTKDNCGYDFECWQGTELVRVEVKTFTDDGRIVISPNELQSAGVHGRAYFLVGFVDAGPEASWASAIVRDPFSRLLEKGSFDMDIVLEIRPKDLFDDHGK